MTHVYSLILCLSQGSNEFCSCDCFSVRLTLSTYCTSPPPPSPLPPPSHPIQCIAAGSHILNHELESEQLRPFAVQLSKAISRVRVTLKEQCLTNRHVYNQKVRGRGKGSLCVCFCVFCIIYLAVVAATISIHRKYITGESSKLDIIRPKAFVHYSEVSLTDWVIEAYGETLRSVHYTADIC